MATVTTMGEDLHGTTAWMSSTKFPGDFIGLLYCGSIFTVYGVVLACTVSKAYHSRPRINGVFQTSFLSSTSFFRTLRAQLLEAAAKVTLSSLGILGVLYIAHQDSAVRTAVHVTVFASYAVVGLVDALNAFNILAFPDVNYVTSLLAGMMQTLDFLHGNDHARNHFEYQMYSQLQLISGVSLVCLFAEFLNRTSFWCVVCRIVATLVQGLWMIEMAFALHKPIKVDMDMPIHTRMMLHTALCCAAVLGAFVFVMFVNDRAQRSTSAALGWKRLEGTTNGEEDFAGDSEKFPTTDGDQRGRTSTTVA
ncbi:uncharacterized protein LOC135400898 [Ornithodoros turicata]|uniref:uncharacterized protein LOC135400898 n=1 Tax=Ornithodoros turicata TaxID=34597 RepID=UPI003139D642